MWSGRYLNSFCYLNIKKTKYHPSLVSGFWWMPKASNPLVKHCMHKAYMRRSFHTHILITASWQDHCQHTACYLATHVGYKIKKRIWHKCLQMTNNSTELWILLATPKTFFKFTSNQIPSHSSWLKSSDALWKNSMICYVARIGSKSARADPLILYSFADIFRSRTAGLKNFNSISYPETRLCC